MNTFSEPGIAHSLISKEYYQMIAISHIYYEKKSNLNESNV